MGRPRKYSDEQIQEIIDSFNAYIDNTDIPIVAEFAYQNKVPRQSLYDYEEFSSLVKRAIDKKEAALERKALNNEVNHTMAIFSLKQLGCPPLDYGILAHLRHGIIQIFDITEVDPAALGNCVPRLNVLQKLRTNGWATLDTVVIAQLLKPAGDVFRKAVGPSHDGPRTLVHGR